MVDDSEDFFKAKAGVPKTLVKQKTSPTFPVFSSEHAYVDESRGELSDLHSIFRLRALRYFGAKFRH